MTSKSCIEANAVEKEETMLVQDTNLELYYQLFFSSSFGDKCLGDNSSIVLGELFVSRMIYLNTQCGIDKGSIASSVQMYVDCSSVDTDLELDLDKVDSIIRQVEYKIDNALYGYKDKASFVTLHLAIQSDTLTEDIARCFVYGIDSNQEFYPEEELLKNQLLLSDYKVFQNAKSCGFNIQIDYFHTFDIRPVLVSNEPIDESIFFSPLEYSEEEISSDTFELEISSTIDLTNSNTSTKITQLPRIEKDALPAYATDYHSSPWPKTESGALKASVVVYDMPDGKWSWKQTSEVAHPVLETMSEASGWISLGTTVLAVTALGVGLVVSAPAVVAVAGLALFATGVSGIISTSASLANASIYYIDSQMERAEGNIDKSEKDFKEMETILLWEGLSLGAGKGVKYGSKFLFKNIKVSNKALGNAVNSTKAKVDIANKNQEETLKEINKITEKRKALSDGIERRKLRIEELEQTTKSSKLSKGKREKAIKDTDKLKKYQKRDQKRKAKIESKINEAQTNYRTTEKTISRYKKEIEGLQNMPSDSAENVTKSVINPPHNSSTNNNNQK